jgi:hypothetical protein
MSPAMDAPRIGQGGDAVCLLANRLTTSMNAMLDEGYSDAVIGSAALTALAGFVGFTMSVGGSRAVSQYEIDFAAERFAIRVREFLAEQAKQLCKAPN